MTTPYILAALSPAAMRKRAEQAAIDADERYQRQRRADAAAHGYRGPLTRHELAQRVLLSQSGDTVHVTFAGTIKGRYQA